MSCLVSSSEGESVMEVIAGVGELLVAAGIVGFSEGYICLACSSKA